MGTSVDSRLGRRDAPRGSLFSLYETPQRRPGTWRLPGPPDRQAGERPRPLGRGRQYRAAPGLLLLPGSDPAYGERLDRSASVPEGRLRESPECWLDERLPLLGVAAG